MGQNSGAELVEEYWMRELVWSLHLLVTERTLVLLAALCCCSCCFDPLPAHNHAGEAP
jgi:hypothetical protein